MVCIKKCFCLFIASLIFTFSAWSEADSSPHVSSRNHIIESTLKNGLRVCLKKSDLEANEFHFQLFAIGGIAHLPITDQPSAWLAANIAWASGLDQLSSDELECALDDHALEMDVKIDLFERKIEAAGPTPELDYCLQMTKLFFTHPQFNEVGLNEALAEARKRLQNIGQASKLADEETALKINLRNWYVMSPFHSLDLDKVNLQKAQYAFKKLFLNPAEFTFVIVGDFDPQQVMSLLEKSLGSLPPHPVMKLNPLDPPSFPDGITKKEFRGKTRYRESLTRLTFPLSVQTPDPTLLDLLCLTLKQELAFESAPGELDKICLNISYSFPLFPYLQPCWLAIKFSSSEQDAADLQQAIIKKLKKIKQRGITSKALQGALQELVSRREQVLDNAYTLSSITHFYKAGWKIEQLYLSPNQNGQEKEMMKKVTDCYPNLDQYSIISLHP
jgi:hypothetical protein